MCARPTLPTEVTFLSTFVQFTYVRQWGGYHIHDQGEMCFERSIVSHDYSAKRCENSCTHTLSLQSTCTLPESRTFRKRSTFPCKAARWSWWSDGVSFWKQKKRAMIKLINSLTDWLISCLTKRLINWMTEWYIEHLISHWWQSG